jgi:hypothetical protein
MPVLATMTAAATIMKRDSGPGVLEVVVTAIYGDRDTAHVLALGQVILSMQLPFCRSQSGHSGSRADGEYMAHARIIKRLADGEELDLHVSGDLAGFDARADAFVCEGMGCCVA